MSTKIRVDIEIKNQTVTNDASQFTVTVQTTPPSQTRKNRRRRTRKKTKNSQTTQTDAPPVDWNDVRRELGIPIPQPGRHTEGAVAAGAEDWNDDDDDFSIIDGWCFWAKVGTVQKLLISFIYLYNQFSLSSVNTYMA